ncbi:MAG: response regulator transcription factor [Verrucomicrobiota bacterium]|nr:response regulator transcription factor [Verrucomicrobiota bacterium]
MDTTVQPRVLIIDDDRKLCSLIKDYLEPMGYSVELAHNGLNGVERADQEPWAAIILDVMLPGIDGFEALKRIRTRTDAPVLMLTARGEEADRIVGLELGADDYLPKTFSSRELLARLRAVTRRGNRKAVSNDLEPDLIVNALRLNPSTRTALLDNQPLLLTAVEFDLLASLMRAPGRVKTREQLLEEVRERDYEVFDRSIDVHIASLRRKLKDDAREPRFIKTVRAVGYTLIPPE